MILTEEEKAKLPEVIRDRERQKEVQLLAKRRREEDRESKLAKIQEIKNKTQKLNDDH